MSDIHAAHIQAFISAWLYSVSLFSYRLSKWVSSLAYFYTVREPMSRPSRREHERGRKIPVFQDVKVNTQTFNYCKKTQ